VYKIALTLEVLTRQDRDALLRDIRRLLLAQPRGITGKIRQTTESEVTSGEWLALMGFGVEELPQPTPVETAIRDALMTAIDEPLPASDDTGETGPASEPEAPEAETTDEATPAADDSEPRTPFDRMLGRELDDETDGQS
jgi:hypothetical protein